MRLYEPKWNETQIPTKMTFKNLFPYCTKIVKFVVIVVIICK